MRSPRLAAALPMVLGLGAAPFAHADWTGRGELGASFASGNSENEAVNAALEMKWTGDRWSHIAGFAGNYGADGNATTAERWELRGQSNYNISDRTYWFGAGRYDDDRFSAFDLQSSLATGLGYRLFDTESNKLWVQAGPGYRYSKLKESGRSESEFIVRGDLGWDYQLTETTKIVERFLVEAGSDNTYLQNDLGLQVTITGGLGLRVGYQVRYNTDVPPRIGNDPRIRSTDTLLTAGIIYERK